MYEKDATLLAKGLAARVPGKASASKGANQSVTVRYQVADAPVAFDITFVSGKIAIQASRDPGGVVWAVREHPVSAAGVAQAIAEMADWWAKQAPPS